MRGSAMGVLAAVLVAFCMAGCGRKLAQPPPKTVAQKSAVPLPEWAPKNPSPEFLRAARVLKPIPPEVLAGIAKESPRLQLRLARTQRLLPAAYECFGTLSDAQIQRFLATKEIRIVVKSLTPKQHAAFDHWLDEYRKAMKGLPGEDEDFLVNLYRLGAKEDLSNVDVGFRARGGGHAVHIDFWIKQADGKEASSGWWFAQI
jgi:hypothetical protein